MGLGLRAFGASDAPFNTWLREVMKEVSTVLTSRSRGHRCRTFLTYNSEG
jgi:hypothetical protein